MSAPRGERPSNLIYDWNTIHLEDSPRPRAIELDDETLRDGFVIAVGQRSDARRKGGFGSSDGSARDLDGRRGAPGAGARAREHISALVKTIRDEKLSIGANVACRTLVSDIEPAAELTQQLGFPLEVCAFIGSSPIRQYAEGWELATMLKNVREAISFLPPA